MYALFNILAATTTTTHSSGKSSASSYTLIFIVLIFGAVYFLFIRPRQQRLRQQQSQARELSIGDEVVSAGGIYGRVVAIDNDVAEVEVSPGVVMTFLRRSISARPTTPPAGNPRPGLFGRPGAGASRNSATAAPQDEPRPPEQDSAPTPGDEEGPGDPTDQRR